MIYAEPCFTFLLRGSALACQYFIICIVEIIQAPVVAQSPVVQWLCMAEQGGCSVSQDIELLRHVEGKQLFLAQRKLGGALGLLFYLEKILIIKN